MVFRPASRLALLGLTLLALGATLPAHADDGSKAPQEVAARIGDWTLTMPEVDRAIQEEKSELEAQLFELRKLQVSDMVGRRLLEVEAKAQGITPQQLLKREVGDKLPPVTDETVAAFIKENKDGLKEGGAGMEAEIKRYLANMNLKLTQKTYLDSLAVKHGAKMLLAPPKPLLYDVKGPQEPARGEATAPVTVIEFSDFECPYCRRAQGAMKDLEKAYPGKIRVVYRHFPLPFHKQAPQAAMASQCAHDQGKFWEYHDVLFENIGKFSPEELAGYAKKLNLDGDRFGKCLKEETHAARVRDDVAEGMRHRVTGTPTYFINGRKVVGAVPLEELVQTVESVLNGKGK